MISRMKVALEEDRILNSQRKPAVRKLCLLPQVLELIKKSNFVETFIKYGLLTEIKKWISPLHDGCLPALPIRVRLLNLLAELPISDPYLLMHSGIRHTVGILLSHPDETQANKTVIRQLINKWVTEMFGQSLEDRELRREKSMRRDVQPQSQPDSSVEETPPPNPVNSWREDPGTLESGDNRDTEVSGHYSRARLPSLSQKVYTVRPPWNLKSTSGWCPVMQQQAMLAKHKKRMFQKSSSEKKRGKK
ncbi:protein IWS1 homolog [Takifugu flavidus]|uniref:protein IWS1 homolog n=1 Tax=Takifugu flavidus TaxID=433684 RepID=UPI00254479FD|nr:protein IWS1 homolog [Takifugu flavidus]